MAALVISVRGIPGSGKTHIANELRARGVRCVDTDDLVSEAYTELARRAGAAPRARFTVDDVLDLAQRNLLALCERSRRGGLLVVVGVTLRVAAPDATLFIEMSESALQAAYKRTVRREVAKYASISTRAVDEALRADRAAPYLACKLHVNAFAPTRPFEEYESVYAAALEFERSNGAIPMSPREILAYVRKCAAKTSGKRRKRRRGLD